MDLLKYNPHWENGFFYDYPKHRLLFDKIIELLNLRQIIAITGLRRTGKSVLLYQTINHLINNDTERYKILYFTFDYEQPTLEELLHEYQIKTGIKLNRREKFYVFLDEVQKLPDFQNQLKLFYDLYPNVKFVISGSTSLFIRKKVSESLAGRIFNLFLKPLNFKEYLNFTNQSHLLKNPGLYENQLIIEFIRSLKKQFIETIPLTDEQTSIYISSIIDKIIYEDIPQFYSISNISILKRILNLLAQYPGMLVNYSQLANELKISNKTVSQYFDILQDAFVVKIFKNFSKNLSSSDRKNKKAYLSSVTFSLILNPTLSEGLAVENYVATQTGAQFYWRDPYKHEVDFVIASENIITAQEVKFKNTLRSEDFKNLIIFAKKFNPQKLEILSKQTSSEDTEINGYKIHIKPVWLE